MAKKEIKRVPHEKFEAILAESGLRTEKQAAFTKVFGPHSDQNRGPRVYVANSKSVGLVNIAELAVDGPGILPVDAKALKLGKVTGELDFSQDEEIVLDAFRRVLDALKASPAPAEVPVTEKKPRARKAAAAPEAAALDGAADAEEPGPSDEEIPVLGEEPEDELPAAEAAETPIKRDTGRLRAAGRISGVSSEEEMAELLLERAAQMLVEEQFPKKK